MTLAVSGALLGAGAPSVRHTAIGQIAVDPVDDGGTIRVLLGRSGDFDTALPDGWPSAKADDTRPNVERAMPTGEQDAPWRAAFSNNTTGDEWIVAVIDDDGAIRRVETVADETPGEAAIAVAREWANGRQLYATHCMRCHGADGGDTSYINIIPLKDMGVTRSVAQIAEASRTTGISNFSSLEEGAQRALAMFIAGL